MILPNHGAPHSPFGTKKPSPRHLPFHKVWIYQGKVIEYKLILLNGFFTFGFHKNSAITPTSN
jgi:hypothetical protein